MGNSAIGWPTNSNSGRHSQSVVYRGGRRTSIQESITPIDTTEQKFQNAVEKLSPFYMVKDGKRSDVGDTHCGVISLVVNSQCNASYPVIDNKHSCNETEDSGNTAANGCTTLKHVWLLPFKDRLPYDALNENRQVLKDVLTQRYLSTFFPSYRKMLRVGSQFSVGSVMFRVTACQPLEGVVDSTTAIHAYGEPLSDRSLRKVHILPVAMSHNNATSSSVPATSDTFERFVRPFFTTHRNWHLTLHESLRIDEMLFKIVAADPPDGIVTTQTAVHLDGDPLILFTFVDFQPLLDCLPMSLQDPDLANREVVLLKLIKPFFDGREGIVREGEVLKIEGVDILVRECLPQDERRSRVGVIGEATRLHISPCYGTLESIRQRQENEDARLATQMEVRDATQAVLLTEGLLPSLRRFAASLPDDNQRQLQITILDMLTQHNIGRTPDTIQVTFETGGASDEEIRAMTLSWNFKKSSDESANKDENGDTLACRICLADYEEYDLIRCLPCFHRFHSVCVTDWLRQNKSCPICKANIDDSVHRNYESALGTSEES